MPKYNDLDHIRDIYSKAKLRSMDGRHLHERFWYRNILNFCGIFWVMYDWSKHRWRQREMPPWVPRPVTNLVESHSATIVQVLEAKEPDASVRPGTDSPEDVAAAEVANRALPVIHKEAETALARKMTASWLTFTGNVFHHPCYDPDPQCVTKFIPDEQCVQCKKIYKPDQLEASQCPQCKGELMPAVDGNGDLIGTDKPRGKIRLDSMITLGPGDLHPGSGQISHLLDDPGVALSLLNLTELMLLISDNSATDLVLKAVGGGPAVNARLAALGVSGISVDRPTVNLIADAIGVKNLPPESDWTLAKFDTLANALSDSMRRAARAAFYQDPRDTATPRGMARLLTKLWRQEALTPASTARLLDMLFRVETGLQRIKGMLPPGIRVAHKTGSLSGVTNDAGILELPGDAGHVALVVFVKQSTAPAATQEQAIAQIARSVYDYFVLVGTGSM